jgi:hypothetical protein
MSDVIARQERDALYSNKKTLIEMENRLRLLELELERVSLPSLFNYPDAEVYQDFVVRKAKIMVEEQQYAIKKFKESNKL